MPCPSAIRRAIAAEAKREAKREAAAQYFASLSATREAKRADRALAIRASSPSPDFSEPEWAARLQGDVPRLAAHIGIHPPRGMSREDWLQDLRETLLVRSWSRKSQWRPEKGRTTWAGWACLVIKARAINIFRASERAKRKLEVLDPFVHVVGGRLLRSPAD